MGEQHSKTINGTKAGDRHEQSLTVEFRYPVYFTTDVFNPKNACLESAIRRREGGRRHRICLVLDRGVVHAAPAVTQAVNGYFVAHSDHLVMAGPPLVVPGGEAAKNDPLALQMVQDHLAALALDRHSVVMIVGGGAVLDMAGYAAAIAHRGLRVVRLPTTVLSQDDSGVSVKNGINGYGRKNYFGTFASPFAVINDVGFLASLPERERIAGLSEAVKAALIRDAGLYGWIERHVDALREGQMDQLAVLIRRSARLHLDHIARSGDPFEQGSARPLDFGHWAAHKIETLSGYAVRHGEAVALGVALDSLYSSRAGFLDQRAADAILMLLHRLGLPLRHDVLADDAVLDGLQEFQEHLGGDLSITLLAGIGRGFESHQIERDLMRAALDDLRRFSDTRSARMRPETVGLER